MSKFVVSADDDSSDASPVASPSYTVDSNGLESVPVVDDATVVDGTDSKDATSSLDNIVPLDKIINGWNYMSVWAMKAAQAAKDKAIEINNNETVVACKAKVSEGSIAAWNKTCEVTRSATDSAAPYVEVASKNIGVAYEKTKEVSYAAAERIKPALETAAANIKPAVETASKATVEFSRSAMSALSGGINGTSTATGSTGAEPSLEMGSPSALDSATKGGNITL